MIMQRKFFEFRASLVPGLQRMVGLLLVLFVFSAGLMSSPTVLAESKGPSLDEISFSTLPGDRVEVKLSLSEKMDEPLHFAIDNPARIAVDLPGIGLNLPRKTQTIGVGMARSIVAVEAGGRTRVVLNLVKLVPYGLRVEGKAVYLTLESAGAAGNIAFSPGADTKKDRRIENVDFRRGENGEARILLTLSDADTVVDTRQEGGKILVDIFASSLPEELQRRLDVVDFATPVTIVDTYARGNDVRMVLETKGGFEHIAYQSDNLFTLDVKRIRKEDVERANKKKFGYTGERLSLNFQSIEVRAVLQLIADFTGLNLVASDTVSGSLTLRLKNVPWDQALDIILRSKGLAMRQAGNVVMVAPSEEIAAREKLELEAQQQITELAPLQTEFIQVNYAKASDLADLLKAKENSLMSERGNVSVDERTNTLLVRDTAENLNSIRGLVLELDVPVRQVLIESRIVIADDNFSKDLGVKFGFSRGTSFDNKTRNLIIGGKLPGDTAFGDPAVTTAFSTDSNENLIVDLPIGSPAGALGFAIGKLGSSLLQLELQAMQADGRGEVLSNPRVITSNQKEAVIEQGTEIPFQEATSSGATSTSFKKAVLSLKVTPQITPDDRVIMDLAVNQDTVGQVFSGVPSINTRELKTQVLVDNGDTVVLGGVYEQVTRDDSQRVPFFGDLPYVGFLFRTTTKRDNKSELLIFVTPKILKETLSVR